MRVLVYVVPLRFSRCFGRSAFNKPLHVNDIIIRFLSEIESEMILSYSDSRIFVENRQIVQVVESLWHQRLFACCKNTGGSCLWPYTALCKDDHFVLSYQKLNNIINEQISHGGQKNRYYIDNEVLGQRNKIIDNQDEISGLVWCRRNAQSKRRFQENIHLKRSAPKMTWY